MSLSSSQLFDLHDGSRQVCAQARLVSNSWQEELMVFIVQASTGCLVILARAVMCGLKVMGFSRLQQSREKKIHISKIRLATGSLNVEVVVNRQ